MTDQRQNYRDFADPEEISIIFKNIDELYKLYSDKKVIELSTEDVMILNLITKMIGEKKKYQGRMDLAYRKWERDRPKSESELKSESYNYPA